MHTNSHQNRHDFKQSHKAVAIKCSQVSCKSTYIRSRKCRDRFAITLCLFGRMATWSGTRYMSRDTPGTPYTRPPVSTDSATRGPTTRRQFAAIYGNLPFSTAICHILPHSATFCQVHRIPPSPAKTATRILFYSMHVLTK
jgi:hypothetical protein